MPRRFTPPWLRESPCLFRIDRGYWSSTEHSINIIDVSVLNVNKNRKKAYIKIETKLRRIRVLSVGISNINENNEKKKNAGGTCNLLK